MAKNKQKLAYDFSGVASEGLFEDKSIIITGRPEEDNDEIYETLAPQVPSDIYNFPEDEEMDGNNIDIKIGIWKARLIKKLGIEKFYEDSEDQINIIKELNPTVDVVKVIDGVSQEKMNFIIFTYDMSIMPVAYKLEKEGNRVIVGVIHDKKQILLPEEEVKPENPESKKKRLSVYDGMMDKYSADEVLKIMKKIKNKDEWFVLVDTNLTYKYAEQALEMGFVNGMFPSEEDLRLENDRKKAKDFVKEHYPDIKVAEVKSFKEVAEGIEFLNQSDDMWVLKSQGDAGETCCPQSENVDFARDEIICKLEEMKSEYEENGFILEPRIIDPIELTPQIVFWNGVPIFTDLDIEVKTLGQGSAVQTGCMMNLIIKTEMEDMINRVAFPEIVFEMAKEKTGLFIWDLSILIDKKGTKYFGEFCSQRFGWDSFPTELAMSGDDEGSKIVTPYFASLMHKKNPLRKRYGVGVRILNIGSNGKMVEDGMVEISDDAEPDVYLYEVKMKDDKIISTNEKFDFAVVTGVSDDLYEAIEHCYKYIEGVMFEGKYFRSKSDFTSYEYSASILKRFNYAKQYGFISTEEDENKEVGHY